MDSSALVADCGSCFGLCCVALAFTASSDFATDKDVGEPCVNLDDGFGCGIHARLRDEGYRGCTVYDCFGAGQKVSQVVFGGVSWRDDPASADEMFAALPIVRQLHELLWYLTEALTIPEASALHHDVRAAHDEIERRTLAPDLLDVDLASTRARVEPLLSRTSALLRAGTPAVDRRGADLLGARLRGADLYGADLRGSLLIAADLRGADLRRADLLGADLRDTRLDGADLTGALYLTQAQVNAARGDAATTLPARLVRPTHWI